MFGMVTGYRLQLGLCGIIYFAPRVTGYKVTRGTVKNERGDGRRRRVGNSKGTRGKGAGVGYKVTTILTDRNN